MLTNCVNGRQTDHLFKWVDAGTAPPRANRILLDRNVENDGSYMALDARGNAMGGIRSPYVDVPVAQYRVPNAGAEVLPTSPSDYIAAQGLGGANLICCLVKRYKRGRANPLIPMQSVRNFWLCFFRGISGRSGF